MGDLVDAPILASDFAAGWMPDICPTTGEPSAERKPTRVTYAPPATLLLLFVGLLVGLIVILMIQKRVTGPVPVRPRGSTHRPRRTGLWIALASVALIVGGIGIAAAVSGAVPRQSGLESVGALLFFTGMIGLVAGVIVQVLRGNRLRGKIYDDPNGARWVVLKAHPAFAHVMASWYHQRAVDAHAHAYQTQYGVMPGQPPTF